MCRLTHHSPILSLSMPSPDADATIRCGPCQMIAPHFEAMSKEFANAIFVKVDVDEQEKIAQMCGIRAMPTFHFFKDGKKVDDLTGANIGAQKSKVQALA